jgi:hypothetical protein
MALRSVCSPAPRLELAVRSVRGAASYGIVSRRMLASDESLILGNELLADVGVLTGSRRERTGYSWRSVREALRAVAPPAVRIGRSEPLRSAWDWFLGYLVLDALVGNVDRHLENWAVIATGGERRLAPSFDHASSLGFQLDDRDRSARLASSDRLRTPQGYADRARSRFDDAPHPVDVAVEGLRDASPAVRDVWIERVLAFTEIGVLVEQLPPDRC